MDQSESMRFLQKLRDKRRKAQDFVKELLDDDTGLHNFGDAHLRVSILDDIITSLEESLK